MPTVTVTRRRPDGTEQTHELTVVLPTFGLREELALELQRTARLRSPLAYLRCAAAAIGLCVPEVGARCGVDPSIATRALADYGEAVYSWLRQERSWTVEQISEAGGQLHRQLAEALWPSVTEVQEAAKNSAGGARE